MNLVLDMILKYNPVVSDEKFIDHFMRLLRIFEKSRLSTSLLNLETVSLLVLSYVKPPKIVFVSLDVDGMYRAELLFSKKKYVFHRDDLSDILDPRVTAKPYSLRKKVSGDYVPVSGKYLVVGKELESYEAKYMVEGSRSWFVYEASDNPVPHNVMYLLSLLR